MLLGKLFCLLKPRDSRKLQRRIEKEGGREMGMDVGAQKLLPSSFQFLLLEVRRNKRFEVGNPSAENTTR